MWPMENKALEVLFLIDFPCKVLFTAHLSLDINKEQINIRNEILYLIKSITYTHISKLIGLEAQK